MYNLKGFQYLQPDLYGLQASLPLQLINLIRTVTEGNPTQQHI